MFKDNLLENKTIIITGGGTGLGKSMAQKIWRVGRKHSYQRKKKGSARRNS